jgi:glycosyltransferase involved in cell wall biosynthesis
MRILHVDPASTWRGGERQVFLLARELARRGHDSSVAAAPHSVLEARCKDAGLTVFPLAIRGDLDPRAILRMLSLLRHPPHILHLHTSRAHGAGGLAARIAGFHPVLVTRRVELPIRSVFSRWKYRMLADHYVAISEEVFVALTRGGVAPERITRIPSGIEIPQVILRRETPRRRVGTLAAFTDQKDPETWIAAALEVCRAREDVEFNWWGEGPGRGALQEIIDRENLGTRIHLPGFQEDLTEFWMGIDLFFIPSRFEALGTSILDAMARGIPVVASRTGGIPEAVRDGVEGDLVPPGNGRGFGQAILSVLGDPAKGRALGEAGRIRAQEFEIGNVVTRIESLYRSLCADAEKGSAS